MIGGLTCGHKDPTANVAIARVDRKEKKKKEKNGKSGRSTNSDGVVGDERLPDLCGDGVAGDPCSCVHGSGAFYNTRACAWGKKKIKRKGGIQ